MTQDMTNDQEFNWGETIMEREAKRAETIAEIREQFPDVKFPSPVLEPMFYGRFDKKEVENRKLMVDKPTGYQFDIVSDDYKLVHHEEVVKMVLDACPPEFGTPEFNIRMLLNGARGLVEAKFPELGKFEINGSPLHPMIRMMNSINRSCHLEYSYGAMELVCTNGLVAFREKDKSKFRHITGSLDKMALEQQIQTDLIGFSEQHKIWQAWAQVQLEKIEIVEVASKLPFSEPEQEKLMTLPLMNHNNDTLETLAKKGKATVWSLNSAATQYARHAVKAEHRGVDMEQEIGRVLNKMYS